MREEELREQERKSLEAIQRTRRFAEILDSPEFREAVEAVKSNILDALLVAKDDEARRDAQARLRNLSDIVAHFRREKSAKVQHERLLDRVRSLLENVKQKGRRKLPPHLDHSGPP